MYQINLLSFLLHCNGLLFVIRIKFYKNLTSFLRSNLAIAIWVFDFPLLRSLESNPPRISRETCISNSSERVTLNVNRQKCTPCPHQSLSNKQRERLFSFVLFFFAYRVYQRFRLKYTKCTRDLDWTWVKKKKWLSLWHFWPLSMWVTFLVGRLGHYLKLAWS